MFATWFGTDKLKMKDVKLDVKVGGAWKGTMVLPDGSEKFWSGVYREIRKPDKLVMTLTDEQPAASSRPTPSRSTSTARPRR